MIAATSVAVSKSFISSSSSFFPTPGLLFATLASTAVFLPLSDQLRVRLVVERLAVKSVLPGATLVQATPIAVLARDAPALLAGDLGLLAAPICGLARGRSSGGGLRGLR